MKIRFSSLILVIFSVLMANVAQGQRKVLAVANVKITPSVEAAASASETRVSLGRVTEAIDGQIIDALNGTRKFEIIARSDLDALLEEGGFTGSGLQVGEAEYLLVPSVDDFQDLVERANFAGIGATAERRRIRLGMVARIYDAKTGKLIESANLQLDNMNSERLLAQSTRKGSFSDELLRQIADEMGKKIAFRVVDVIFPARIVAKTGKQITINRGDGAGIAVGETWEVFVLGEELFDPDTGTSLGREEYPVGFVRVVRVNPQTSLAEVLGEDLGIDRGAVLRRKP